jgi:glyoxylase-like metal-dependent hydrolase (beta-lactamase superfamily II)
MGPTFPNARYLFGRLEWEHWSREVHSNGDMPQMVVELAEQNRVMVDSVLPIVDAGLHELVETDHRLTDEVMLHSTPGHSPGHVSVAIRSQGQEAAITGDVIHNPIQFTDPGICANFDFDQKVGLATRQAFINNHADRDVLILGTHFPTPAVGHIVRDGERWRFTPVNADVS